MSRFAWSNFSKSIFLLGILIFFLGNCNPINSLQSNKKYNGLLSFVSTYSNSLNNALIQVSGTLVAEDGITPLSNASLFINYSFFNLSSKAIVDSKVTTDTSGNFSMSLNIGKFTVTVFSSTGENLGSFTINISSFSTTPTIDKSGKFGVINLAVKPVSSTPTPNCDSSLCGFISGSSSSFGKFFVFGSSNESNNVNSPVIYETTDGINFIKYKVTLGSCVSLYSTTSSTECRITSVAYDGSKYFVMGLKSNCASNSCTTSNTYAGMSTSLNTISINEVSVPASNNDPNQNYVYANGVFHYISYSNGTKINSSSNGNSFSSFTIPSTGSSILQNTCQNLYIGENGLPFCGLKYFYNGTWTATTTDVTNSIPTSYINFNLRASYNKGTYQILTYDTSTLKSSLFNGYGSLIPNSAFSTASNPSFSEVGSSTLPFSTSNYILLFLADITTGSPSSPPTLNSIKIVRSSDGAIYTSTSITLPVRITYTMGFGSTNSHLFLAGYATDSSNTTRSYLFRSTDGITWTTVNLP